MPTNPGQITISFPLWVFSLSNYITNFLPQSVITLFYETIDFLYRKLDAQNQLISEKVFRKETL